MRLILLIAGLGLLVGCTEEVQVENTPIVEVTPARLAPPLAWLEEFLPRVTFRRQSEHAWNDVAPKLALYAYDSVQTHAIARATLALKNGSELKMKENTLVIITPELLKMGVSSDRAVVHAGELTGQTQKELWLLTSAALLRIRAGRTARVARTRLTVKDGKKLKVELEAGEGVFVERRVPAEKRKLVALVPAKPVEIEAPGESKELGSRVDEKDWELPSEEPPQRAVSAVPAKPVNVIITAPPNFSELQEASIDITGRVTGPGGKLLINGRDVKIGNDLKFALPMPLRKGPNNFLIQMIQKDGKSVFRRWTVMRK